MGYLISKGTAPEAYESPIGSIGTPLLDDVRSGSHLMHNIKSVDMPLALLRMSNTHFALADETEYSLTIILLFSLAQKKRDARSSRNPSPLLDANLTGFVDAIGKLDDSDVEKLDSVATSGK